MLPKGVWITREEYYLHLLQEKTNSLNHKNLIINKMFISKGKPPFKILSYANKNKFDLIIIGAHGKYFIRDTFVGTTAEYMAKKTKCPILIIKNKPKKSYKNIFIPIDFSKASKNTLMLATQLFSESNIELFHVGDYEFEELLKKEEKADGIPNNNPLFKSTCPP